MSDKNKNMDNEQTIYIPENKTRTNAVMMNKGQYSQNSQNNPAIQPRTPQNNAYGAPPVTPPRTPQNNAYGAPPVTPPRTPQNNAYGAPPVTPPRTPQNNAYGAQPFIPPQMPQNSMYGMPAGYGDLRMRQAALPGYGKERKKGNAVVVLLIVSIILVIFAVVGIAAFIILNDSNDDDGKAERDGKSDFAEYGRIDESDEDSVYEYESQTDYEEEPITEPQTTAPVQPIITVPDVVGWSGDRAAEVLSEMGFTVEIEKQYSIELSGTVISQSIAAETSVAEGTKIILTVSKGVDPAEEDVIVPDVCGMPEENAKSVMQKRGLLAYTKYEYSDTVAEGEIADQDIASGTKVKKGSTVLLTVSKGSSNQNSQYQRGKVATKETELNVRKGPGKQYEITGTVDKDSIVEIVSLEGDWYKIVFGDGFGYVSKDYIQLMN